MGLNERECGQMGVIMIAGTLGWIMEAPAATAYAVLPVGVDTITPEEKCKCYIHTSLLSVKVYDKSFTIKAFFL